MLKQAGQRQTILKTRKECQVQACQEFKKKTGFYL